MRSFVCRWGGMLTLVGPCLWFAMPQSFSQRGEAAAAGTRRGGLVGVTGGYTLTDLGTPESTFSCAYALNNRGDVVGVARTGRGAQHAFLYRRSGRRDLGAGGGRSSTAAGINDAGQVVGQMTGRRGRKSPFFWVDGPMQEIGGFRGRTSAAQAINLSGEVVGEFLDDAGKQVRGFRWRAGRKPLSLNTLGGSDSRAWDINDAGVIVGVAATRFNWSHHACLWQRDRITDLSPRSPGESEARAINNRGVIVGSAHTDTEEEHACRFRDGGVTDLGTLGGKTSQALGINEAGVVVGWSATADGGSHAVLWQDGGIRDLNALAASAGGWILTSAHAINDRGQIVGSGLRRGGARAFLLTPRE